MISNVKYPKFDIKTDKEYYGDIDLAHVLKMSREVSSFFEEVSQNVHSDFNILKPFFNNFLATLNISSSFNR